jgi:hypothetical protein
MGSTQGGIQFKVNQGKIGKIMVQYQSGQKVHETPSQPIISWAQWFTPVIPALAGSLK